MVATAAEGFVYSSMSPDALRVVLSPGTQSGLFTLNPALFFSSHLPPSFTLFIGLSQVFSVSPN